MQRIDYGDQKATLDALPAADGSPGYFTDGSPPTTPPTTIHAGWLNLIQEEICNLLEDFSVTLSRSNDEQLRDLMRARIKAIRCATADTGDATNDYLRVLIASVVARATGTCAAVIASDGTGSASLLAAGDDSAIIASRGTTANPVTIDGDRSASLAVDDCTIDSNSARTAMIASNNSSMVSGLSAAVIASGGCTGGGSQAAVAASSGGTMNTGAEDSAMVASLNAAMGTTTQSMLVTSRNCELADNFTLAGGYNASGITPSDSNQNLTWKVDTTTGNFVIDGTYSTAGADYAEYFRRLPGHPKIPTGHFVALMPNPDGSGLYAVTAGEGDEALGIVSSAPGVVGNNPRLWGQIQTDELGAPIVGDGYTSGETIEPVPYDIVGLLGQVRCYFVGDLAPGDKIVPTFFGKGRKANPGEGGYRVLRITAPGIAEVLVR